MPRFAQWLIRWHPLEQVLVGVVGPLLELSLGAPAGIVDRGHPGFFQFAVVLAFVVTGLFLALAGKYQSPKHWRTWAVTAVVSLLAAVLLYVASDRVIASFTRLHGGRTIIIGSEAEYTEKAGRYLKDGGLTTVDELIDKYPDEIQDFWPRQHLFIRYVVVALLFLAALNTVMVCVLAVLQAVYCAYAPRKVPEEPGAPEEPAGESRPRGHSAVDGSQMEETRDALCDAFDLDDLDEVLRFRLNIVRRDIVADGPMKSVTFRLLEVAQRGGWENDLVVAAYRFRPRNPMIRAVYQKYGLAPRGFPDLTGLGALESIIRASNSTLNMDEWCERAARVEDRVCRIELQNQPTATGFLVGPDVVLTNCHVVQPVLDNRVPATAVAVRFGYKQLADQSIVSGRVYRLASDWKIDNSPLSPLDLGDAPNDADRDPQQLDYALLRVEGRPGEDKVDQRGSASAPVRGWLTLTEAEVDWQPESALFIVQHPQGSPLQLALDTSAIITANANRTRVRYKTNTEHGSSGSPCFNLFWELVALHQMGDPAFRDRYNQGIPIAAIRKLLKARGLDAEVGKPPP
jgi:hypothetical protein